MNIASLPFSEILKFKFQWKFFSCRVRCATIICKIWRVAFKYCRHGLYVWVMSVFLILPPTQWRFKVWHLTHDSNSKNEIPGFQHEAQLFCDHRHYNCSDWLGGTRNFLLKYRICVSLPFHCRVPLQLCLKTYNLHLCCKKWHSIQNNLIIIQYTYDIGMFIFIQLLFIFLYYVAQQKGFSILYVLFLSRSFRDVL